MKTSTEKPILYQKQSRQKMVKLRRGIIKFNILPKNSKAPAIAGTSKQKMFSELEYTSSNKRLNGVAMKDVRRTMANTYIHIHSSFYLFGG